MRFNRKGKLALRYIVPFEILEKVGKVAYQLVLSINMLNIHNLIHVLLLVKTLENNPCADD